MTQELYGLGKKPSFSNKKELSFFPKSKDPCNVAYKALFNSVYITFLLFLWIKTVHKRGQYRSRNLQLANQFNMNQLINVGLREGSGYIQHGHYLFFKASIMHDMKNDSMYIVEDNV